VRIRANISGVLITVFAGSPIQYYILLANASAMITSPIQSEHISLQRGSTL